MYDLRPLSVPPMSPDRRRTGSGILLAAADPGRSPLDDATSSLDSVDERSTERGTSITSKSNQGMSGEIRLHPEWSAGTWGSARPIRRPPTSLRMRSSSSRTKVPPLATSHRPNPWRLISQYERASTALNRRQPGEDALCFDPTRHAIFLVAGDKTGNWQRWYTRAISIGRMNVSLST